MRHMQGSHDKTATIGFDPLLAVRLGVGRSRAPCAPRGSREHCRILHGNYKEVCLRLNAASRPEKVGDETGVLPLRLLRESTPCYEARVFITLLGDVSHRVFVGSYSNIAMAAFSPPRLEPLPALQADPDYGKQTSTRIPQYGGVHDRPHPERC